jgi:hypothetical protein
MSEKLSVVVMYHWLIKPYQISLLLQLAFEMQQLKIAFF